jgi:hypothetical protein
MQQQSLVALSKFRKLELKPKMSHHKKRKKEREKVNNYTKGITNSDIIKGI